VEKVENVKINLINCYGIKHIEKEFDFSQQKAYIIYASNGSMKTSFTKTLKDISVGHAPKEEIFGRESFYEVKDETDKSLKSEDIFVIETYDENYYSKRVSSLIMNKELQDKYNTILQNILLKKNEFIDKIKITIGGKIVVEEEYINTFKDKEFLTILEKIYDEDINSVEDSGLDFSEINYNSLFDPKVEDFIKDDTNFRLLMEYGTEYDTLVEKSTFLKKGVFSQYNAVSINDSLDENGFFKAGHEITLENGIEIKTSEEFNTLIEKEKVTILSNPSLIKRFDKIDKQLSKNSSLRNFRIIIENFPEIISKLINFNKFKKEVLITVLKKHKELFISLMEIYKSAKGHINKITESARIESDIWRKVVDIFTNRFYVPFSITIRNQEDVILKNSVPTFVFKYNDNGEEQEIERGKLNMVLSGGEKRALYLLNIIFEMEALKKAGKQVLVIADDIAESFDYKNKYAIIEYLMENVSCGLFNFIILTHNFDFYRTVGSRILGFNRQHCVMAIRKTDGIEIIDGHYLKNVFSTWKDLLGTNDIILIASIPFIRNIIEYIESDQNPDYLLLTKLLHVINYTSGEKTKEITLEKLEKIINDYWRVNKKIAKGREKKSVYSLIIDVANDVYSNADSDEMNLENKISLSMAIRFIAEEFMIKEIIEDMGSSEEIERITVNQTGKLLALYKKGIRTNKNILPTLEQVNLMTAENIHLNTFMYEPLIDISIHSLKKLYKDLLLFSAG
jgi:energy-coupling factor transporter ATP-binding protein EcfA2